MGDEVSKKDLQALQANINRQIADLKKQIADLKSDSNKDSDELNKITVTVRQDLGKMIGAADTKIEKQQDAINTLARAISEVAQKVKR